MHLTDKKINDIHIPRYNELPNFNLYMDQVVDYLKQSLYFLGMSGQENFITSTMINNYVNQGIIDPPANKRYSSDHIAYLIVLCITKQTYSMQEINALLDYQIATYSNAQAYDYFCDEFETCLKNLIHRHQIEHTPSLDEGQLAVYVIRNVILSICTKLIVQNDLQSSNLR